MPRDCHVSAYTGCTDCPEIEPTPGTSAYLDITNIVGWNAVSNSENAYDGDVHAVFRPRLPVLGAVVGFRGATRWPFSAFVRPETIPHAFYFTTVAGHPFYSVLERGVAIGGNHPFTGSDMFEIRREGGLVSYRVNDTVLQYSALASHGFVLVTACLYASGDAIL